MTPLLAAHCLSIAKCVLLRRSPSSVRLIVLLLSAWLFVWLTAACSATPASARPAESPVAQLSNTDIVTVDEEETRDGPLLSGALAPARRATVASEIAGAVLEVRVDAGSRVAAGTPLARVDDHTQRAAFASAESALRNALGASGAAARRVARAERLLAAGAVSAEEVEEARDKASSADADVAAARSRLADAVSELAHTTVRSPITGVVSRKLVSTGDVLQAGSVLFEVIDPSSMRLEAAIPSIAVAALHPGAAVTFTVTGYPGRTFSGRVDRVHPAADRETRLVPVLVTIDNREQRLVAGLYAEGRVTTVVRRALVVPASAVDGAGVAPTVLRISADRATAVPVRLGARSIERGTIEIVDGLARGDTIVIDNTRGVTAGSVVRIDAAARATTAPVR